MKLKVCSTILIWFALVGLASAQYRLEGVVVNKANGKPIEDAQIYVQNTNDLAHTNANGKFVIESIKPGEYLITVFVFEFEPITTRVFVQGHTTHRFEVEELSEELSEVVISQKKEEIFGLRRLQPVEGTAIYAGKKTEVVLMDQIVGNMASNNARQLYGQVVGLNIYESNDGGLQLSIGGRGLDPNRTSNFNTRQNGYDISADVLGYPESYYTPPAEALEEIEVIRGAASLQYGTQFGGLINFKMKKPVPGEKVSLVSRQSVGSFGLFTSFNSLSGTVGKFSYYTYFNYKKGDGYRPNSAFDSKNYYGHFNYEFSDQTSLSFDFTYLHYLAQQPGGTWDAQFARDPLFSNRERNWFEVDWKLYALKLKHEFSDKTDFSLTLFGLDAERNALGFRGLPGESGANRSPVEEPDWILENGEYENPRDLIMGEFNNWGLEARLLSRYTFVGNDAAFLIGAKYYHANNTSQQGAGSFDTDADFTFDLSNTTYPHQSSFEYPNRNLAVFGENVFYLNDQLSITPGFRLEYIKTESRGSYYNEIRDQYLTDNRTLPRTFVLLGVGISNEFSSKLEFYSNISQNYRSVTFSDIRTVNPSFVIDADIGDEKGYTFDFGLRGRLKNHVSYDLSGYTVLYNDRIGTVFNDRAERVRGNVADAIIYGMELFADWNVLSMFDGQLEEYKLSWFVNLALTGSEYFNPAENNNGVEGNKVEFIPLVNLKTGYRFGYKNFLGSAQFSYFSKQFTDAQNSSPTVEGDARSGIIGEIPAYHILDLSLSYKYKMFKLETGINNLTDNNYFTRRATGYPGPGIIPSEGRGYYVTLELKL